MKPVNKYKSCKIKKVLMQEISFFSNIVSQLFIQTLLSQKTFKKEKSCISFQTRDCSYTSNNIAYTPRKRMQS